ncbi:MAG TPA: L,D-transpeptidase/peptidoglycan binding protein, partial [Acidimicrobiia bacterium]|nr:L,D-transpeptidase/peptidoglycan binding protein [Acidimicrobiia bacterium]
MATRQGAESGAFALVRRRVRIRGRFGRGPRVAAGVVFGLAVLAGAAAAWAVHYDNSTISKLPSNTTIGGVQVGGLTYQPAVDRLKARLEAPLHEPIHVSADGFQADTTAWDLGLQLDVRSAVTKAMAANHDGNLFDRVWRRWRGADRRTIRLEPTWKAGLSSSLLEQAKKTVAVSPKSARMDTSSGFVRITQDVDGRALDVDQAKTVLTESLQRGDKRIQLPVVHPRAAVQSSAFGTVILVRTGENKLYLYKNGKLARTYSVATGRPEF